MYDSYKKKEVQNKITEVDEQLHILQTASPNM